MSEKIRDAVQHNSLGRNTRREGEMSFRESARGQTSHKSSTVGWARLLTSLFKGSLSFLCRASADQTQLFGAEGWGKYEFASSYRERGDMSLYGRLRRMEVGITDVPAEMLASWEQADLWLCAEQLVPSQSMAKLSLATEVASGCWSPGVRSQGTTVPTG